MILRSGERRLRIVFMTPSTVRITLTQGRAFADRVSRMVVAAAALVAYDLQEDADCFRLTTESLMLVIAKASGAIQYRDAKGNLLLSEPARGGKWLTAKTIARNVFDRSATVRTGQSIDGARADAAAYTTVLDRHAFEAKLELVFTPEEALFGLGSHEEGYGNLRGRSRELYQQNMKAVVPHLVSTRGWGLLMDCSSLMTFHDDALGSYWWADVVEELDFYFIQGDDFPGVMRGYRYLTGATPLPPKWAFGFVQSKERYVTAAEMIEVVHEHRRREIPLDCIVLDWKSWPNGSGWGQKSFDPLRFPEPSALMETLHGLGVKVMVSIWPIMTGGCENQRELLGRQLMLGNQSTYDAFSAEARDCYWQQAQRGLFAHGVDAWWCDCTEPFEADWAGAVKPEPHVRLLLNTEASKLYLDAGDINAYSLVHSQGIYEGQRQATNQKRVLNLTRSSYAGQHRYGTVTWNGDICATWEALRRSIPEGVNFCATGEAYWTVDAGGFFLANNPELWFWRGDYDAGCRGLTSPDAIQPDPADTGCTDLGFWELYTRWLQYAVFLPMFRSHGTDAAREIWRFGEQGSPFYDAIARTIRLRYELLPYIYSLAAAVTARGEPMVCAVALRFPHDRVTYSLLDEYLFGPALLVCPVTKPMYFDHGSRALAGIPKRRTVYLPAGTDWYDFWTGAWMAGGQALEAECPLEIVPVFAQAGSIVPMTCSMPFVDALPEAPLMLRVFTGSDATFTLYEDRGDGYGYELGECCHTVCRWEEEHGRLQIQARQGSFAGMVSTRMINITFFSRFESRSESVQYDGQALCVRINAERGSH